MIHVTLFHWLALASDWVSMSDLAFQNKQHSAATQAQTTTELIFTTNIVLFSWNVAHYKLPTINCPTLRHLYRHQQFNIASLQSTKSRKSRVGAFLRINVGWHHAVAKTFRTNKRDYNRYCDGGRCSSVTGPETLFIALMSLKCNAAYLKVILASALVSVWTDL